MSFLTVLHSVHIFNLGSFFNSQDFERRFERNYAEITDSADINV